MLTFLAEATWISHSCSYRSHSAGQNRALIYKSIALKHKSPSQLLATLGREEIFLLTHNCRLALSWVLQFISLGREALLRLCRAAQCVCVSCSNSHSHLLCLHRITSHVQILLHGYVRSKIQEVRLLGYRVNVTFVLLELTVLLGSNTHPAVCCSSKSKMVAYKGLIF